MRTLPLLFAFALAAGAAPKIYLVHDEAAPMERLAAYLTRSGHPASAEDQPAFKRHMRSLRPEAVFMYVHGDFDPDIEDYLIEYAQRGGRLIVLHHGMASGKMRSRRWMPFLGVRIVTAPDPNQWAVLRGDFHLVNLNPGHYVTAHQVRYPETVAYTPSDAPSAEQNLPSIRIPDTEIFLNQIFTDGRAKTVLFGFKAEVGGRIHMQDRAGWLMPAGRGHVFYFQPGHQARDFDHPVYARILLNAVEWKP